MQYYDVVQVVEPKRAVLRKFILQLDAALKRLSAAKETLGQMQSRLAKLKRDVGVRHSLSFLLSPHKRFRFSFFQF